MVSSAPDDVDPTVDLHGGPPTVAEPDPPAGEDTEAPTLHRATYEHAPTTVDSADSALAHVEILRSRQLGKIGSTLSAAIAAVVPVLGGPLSSQMLAYVGCGLVFFSNIWLVWLTGAPRRYRWWKIAVIWYVATVGISVGVLYFGVFSPASIVCGLGIYFVSLGGNRMLAFGVYGSIAVILGTVAVLAALGVIHDPGLLTAAELSRTQQLIVTGLFEMILLAIYLIGRLSQKAVANTVHELEDAMRAVAQREAQLDEARDDLRRALQVGGAGPWSGRLVGGWEIGRLIGRGAMGEVYEAARPGLERPVAIKLLSPSSAANPHLIERFRREVEAARRLEVPSVVEVLAVSGPSDSLPYLVMELLEGRDLAAVLRERNLEHPEVIQLTQDTAAGLVAAAGAGIVHRDIKPQNLFRLEKPDPVRWKILDFGVSKLAESSGTLTAGHVVGTPAYMAPEQAQSIEVDHRADTYGLAAIAYRCLTGRPPFRGREPAAVIYNVVYNMPLRPTSLATLPADIDLVLALGMAKDPDDRFDSADAFASALTDALDGALDDQLRRQARALLDVSPWRLP